jgi:hypothetical protein
LEQEVHNDERKNAHAIEAPNTEETKRGISMKQDAFDTSNVVEKEQDVTLQSIPIEPDSSVSLTRETVYNALSIETLVAQCSREIDNYRRGEPWNDEYALELLRRAIVQENHEAWSGMQHCFSGLVCKWLRRHPKSGVALRLNSEENYVVQTFERFWQAAALNRHMEFITLAAALQYLRASLNGVILDTLRTYARPGEVMLSEIGEAKELQTEDTAGRSEVWEALQAMLSDEREKRLAYLLFHCSLSPEDIVESYSQEFNDVREVSHLRHSIFKQYLHRVDHSKGEKTPGSAARWLREGEK